MSVATPAGANPAVDVPSGGWLRRWAVPVVAIAVVATFVATAIGRWDLWIGASSVQTTYDATIRAELTSLSARVAGNVVNVAVEDFQRVAAGDLLVVIDPADFAVAVAQAEAGVAHAKGVLANLNNEIALQRTAIAQAEAQVSATAARAAQTTKEQERQQKLLKSTFGTPQKVEQAVADLAGAEAAHDTAVAAVAAAHAQLDVLAGTRTQRAADVAAAEANLAAAQLRQSYTRIVAPFGGVVGERQVQPGDYVSAGGRLISVVPLPDVYIVANYKETQLTNVAPGQPVEVTVDTFPGETLSGRVDRISPASGSQFALLPPDNATGNFTKVVQRIPVRITLDAGQPLIERLRPGMSVVTRIRTGDRE